MPRRIFSLIVTLTLLVPFVAASDGSIDSWLSTAPTGEVRRWEVTGPWGGDVRSLVVAPDNANHLYLGTSDGQVFRSTDGAATWRRVKPGLGLRGLSVDYIVIDPRNPKTIYIGAWAVTPGVEEQGVYKSEDGGETWKLLEGTRGMPILSVAMAPSDSNMLIAGAKNGVFRSRDAGKTWERISPEGHPEIRNVNSAAVDPLDTNLIYIGTNHLPWKTLNGGKTWEQTGYKAIGMIDDTDVMGICVNPKNPDLVYMNGCSGIYRSTNRGEKWTKLPGIPFSARRTYALLPHPTDSNIIFAGTSEGLWRSKDGGKRWMLLTSKTLVIRAIVVHPDRPNRVLVATDDMGVMMSDDLGDTLATANEGFIHRHILAILPDATERGRVLASVYHDGTTGSLFVSTDGGESWTPSSRGLGTRDVFALYQVPEAPNVIYAGTSTGIFRSDDRGASWTFVSMDKPAPAKKPARRRRAAASPAIWSPAEGARYQAVAVQRRRSRAPQKRGPARKAAPAPAEPLGPPTFELTKQVDDISAFTDNAGRRGLMAATMDGLYRTFDEKKGWEKVLIDGYDPNGRVFSVQTHRDTPNKIYVGTRQGLFISNDGGASWMAVERGPSDMSVKTVAIDPRDPDLVIVGTNYTVFRSTNGGRTWTRRGGGLGAGDFTAVVFHPRNPEEVYIADYSRGGIYRSTDRGYFWERIDTELPSNRVWTLTFDPFDDDRIYAGSFSSGVYVLTIQRGASSGQR